MRASLRHAIAVWQRNASLYSRTWKITILPNFFEPVFYLTAIGIEYPVENVGIGGLWLVQPQQLIEADPAITVRQPDDRIC